MRTGILTATALASTLMAGLALAQAPKAEEDHSSHHPTGSAPAASAPAPSPAAGPAPSSEAFKPQMKAMQDMHQKMQTAKTPAERARLMDAHMKLMQSGMAMVGHMRGGMAEMSSMAGAASAGMGTMSPGAPGAGGQTSADKPSGMGGMMGMHLQMERRMALMEEMMQMMVDREAARPGK